MAIAAATAATAVPAMIVSEEARVMTPWRVVPGMTFLGVARVMTSWKAVPEMINL